MSSCKEEALRKIAWEELKERGSQHYKGTDVQLIDILRDMMPHPSLTVLDVFALVCDAKYAIRQIERGKIKSDCDKINHYTDMILWGIE